MERRARTTLEHAEDKPSLLLPLSTLGTGERDLLVAAVGNYTLNAVSRFARD